MFELQAAHAPQATALVQQSVTLSYGQLNSHANQLARWLIQHGVGAENVVAFALPRSSQMFLALLAVLKAGAAYLPLDIDYPPERLGFMLTDSRAVFTLTRTDCLARLPADARPICLDDPQLLDSLAHLPDTNLTDSERRHPLRPAHPAYLIYTSGSTGRPKGVLITHHSITNYLSWNLHTHYTPRQAEPPQGDPTANGSPTVFSISFDAGITTVLGALTAGQALHLLPSGHEVDSLAATERDPATGWSKSPLHT